MKKNMAKHIRLFFLAFLAMILCSCQGLPHDGIGSTTEIIEVDIAPYFSRDWDAFLADLENVQKTDQKEHFLWLEDKEEGIVLPILQSDDYSLLAVEVYPSWFEFFYMPYDSEERFFQSDVGFWIQVRRTSDDFLNGLERYREEITVIDENTYYCPKDNRWDFLYGENSVLIVCPESVVLDRPEQLEEYFVFELFTFGDAEHELPEGDDKTPPEDPPLSQSIEIRNLEKLNEMREMVSCDDEMQVEQYVQSIADSGIRSKDELIAFVKIVDSLPHIPVLDGSITWLCFSHSISEDTGEETNVVYVTTEAANGDWTRVEYVLSVTDASQRISDEKISIGESSLLASPVKSSDGKLTLHTETRAPHPSGKGTMIQWVGEVNGIFTRIYYYTDTPSGVKTDSLFGSVEISDISQ